MSFYKKLFRYGLSKIEKGTLTVKETYAGGETYSFRGAKPGYSAEISVQDPFCGCACNWKQIKRDALNSTCKSTIY